MTFGEAHCVPAVVRRQGSPAGSGIRCKYFLSFCCKGKVPVFASRANEVHVR